MQGQAAQFFSQRKDPQGSWGLELVELEGSLAETSKSRRLGHSQVRFDSARFTGRKESIASKSV